MLFGQINFTLAYCQSNKVILSDSMHLFYSLLLSVSELHTFWVLLNELAKSCLFPFPLLLFSPQVWLLQLLGPTLFLQH